MAKTNNRTSAASRFVLAMKMTNTILSLQLRSPFHKRVSKTLMLLTFRGRKSGKKYSFPVGYIHESKDDLVVLTPVMRSWWKNFRTDAPVTVYVQGRKQQGMARVLHNDRESVAQGITAFLRSNPKAASMYRIELDASGKPTTETLSQVVPHWIALKIHLIS